MMLFRAIRGQVGVVHDVEVGDLVPAVLASAPQPHQRARGHVHGPVTHRVDVHVEPLGVRGGHDVFQLVLVEHGHAAFLAVVAIGRQHGAREVLAHPVDHDLHRTHRKSAQAVRRCGAAGLGHQSPAFHHAGQLRVEIQRPVPPQRPGDPRGQRSPALQIRICGEGVRAAQHGADPGVLPAGDAQRMVVVL
jgi:hypothetical protein